MRCDICTGSRPEWSYEAVTVGEDVFHVCAGCASRYDGPGRWEGIHESDRALAAVLEQLASVSGEDEYLSDEWNGYAGVFANHMLIQDAQGFVDVRTFKDPAAAVRELRSFEDDGMGADEEDAYINYGNDGLEVSFAGKYIGRYQTLRRAQACVSVLMRREGFYPNVWLTGEHGPSIRRIDVW